VAVLSGCVPVIFDGGDGSTLYSNGAPTFWPWRVFGTEHAPRGASNNFKALRHRIGLNYLSFTISLNTSEVCCMILCALTAVAYHGAMRRLAWKIVSQVLEHAGSEVLTSMAGNASNTSISASFLHVVLDMPTFDPGRLARLQAGVDKAAPAFVVAPYRSAGTPRHDDAFARYLHFIIAPEVMKSFKGSHLHRHPRHRQFEISR